MKHYKNDPDLNAEINAIVAAEIATLRAEVERLRGALNEIKSISHWNSKQHQIARKAVK